MTLVERVRAAAAGPGASADDAGTDLWRRPLVARYRAPVAFAALGVVLAVVLSTYWEFLGVVACEDLLLAFSVGLLFNRAGMLALCPLAFAGAGAWIVAYFQVDVPVPFVVAMLLAVVIAVPIGAVIGLLAIRLRGMNLALATLGVGVLAETLFTPLPIPGAALGKVVNRPEWASSQRGYLLLCLAVVLVVVVAYDRVMSSRLGASWIMLKSERATAAGGVNVVGAKLSAFCVSAALATVAGAMMVGQSGAVDPTSFNVAASLQVVVTAILFGAGRMEGAVAAGVVGAFFPEVFTRLNIAADWSSLLFGLGALLVLRQGGDGIAAVSQAKRRAKRAASAEHHMTPLPGAGPAAAGTITATITPPARTGSGADAAGAPARPPAPAGARQPVAAAPAGHAPPALEVRGLTVRYGAVVAVDGVDITVPSGMVAGLIGPNGAGKTTLIDACAGYVRYQRGEVSVAGQRLDALPPQRRARLGLRRTFQQSRSPEDLTVGQYLSFMAGRSLGRAEMLEILGLLRCPPPDRYIGNLDVPTRRLVEVAAAIGARPTVLMLDEPAAGLGESESRDLGARLQYLSGELGISLLLVEHDMSVVRSACHSVTVVDYGRVIAAGDPADVLARPEVRTAYLGGSD